MATFTVSTATDVINPNDGVLSLREAVRQANASTAADRIVFASELEGKTLVLTHGELTVKQDVTIDGDRNNDGKEVTVSGGDVSRILRTGYSTDVSLLDLKITHGHALGNGGAIYSGGGILRLVDCTVQESYARGDHQGGGGIFAASFTSLTLSDCAITGCRAYGEYAMGGGIYAGDFARIDISDSIIARNTATVDAAGGGIFGYRGVELSIRNSVIADNSGDLGGGPGGIVLFNYGSLVMESSTVSGNGGGGISFGEELLLSNSTITGNNGGVFGGLIEVANSIISGNFNRDGVADDVTAAVTRSNGHNIFGSDVGGAIIGDLQGVAPSLLFAALDPDTGGGMANAAGIVPLRSNITNPALSGGDPLAALPTDQIGTAPPLPAGSLPDIGAAERNQALSTHPSANNDVLTGTDGIDTIAGKAGADLILGRGGKDSLHGDGGSDVLEGGPGNDLLDGDDGIDLARFGGSSAVTIDLIAGTAKRGAETDTLTSIQGAIGSSAGDTFKGDGGPNWFQGNGGRDVATGGAARDLYDFDRVQDSLPGGARRDVITDFAPQSDRMDVTGIDADSTQAGNQAFRFIDTSPLTGPAQLDFIVSDGGNIIVRGSTDADAAPEFALQLNGTLAPTEVDFLL